MAVYISFLRGINVSGSKLIKMELLKQLYSKLNFSHIQTYLQSGNVVFTANEMNQAQLSKNISDSIFFQTGFDVEVFVLTLEQLQEILDQNPFANSSTTEIISCYFTLLAAIPSTELVQKLKTFETTDELLDVKTKIVYLNLYKGYGKSKLNNNFIESKLKVSATTRNLKTMHALAKMAEEIKQKSPES